MIILLKFGKRGKGHVSKYPKLVVASCGHSIHERMRNIKDVIELYARNAETFRVLVENKLGDNKKVLLTQRKMGKKW